MVRFIGKWAYAFDRVGVKRLDDDEWRSRRPSWIWLIVALAALIVVPLLVSALFFALRTMEQAFFPSVGYYPFFFPFGWIFGFIIIFFVLRWIFWPWSWGTRHRRGYWGYRDEYHILRVRYARGEITKDQFDQMTRDLRESSQRTQGPT